MHFYIRWILDLWTKLVFMGDTFRSVFLYLTTRELFVAVESPGSSLCHIPYHPMAVLLYTASFVGTSQDLSVIPGLYFFILHQYVSDKYLILHRVQPV